MTIDGKLSHIKRTVLVYLPPQYFQAAYAKYRFPAIELFTGYPGQPSDWINILGITTMLPALVQHHLADPVILVMPDTEGNPHRDLQCLNLPHSIQDATFLARDVPDFLARTIRVLPPGQGWGAAGYSEGGFCTANLALQYRNDFGFAGVLSGYFSPLDVLVGKAYTQPFGGNPALRDLNTPLDELPVIPAAEHIPQFWVGAGGADPQDLAAARQFMQLLLPTEPTAHLQVWAGGGHNGDTWRGLLPPMLMWMTRNLTVAGEPGKFARPPGVFPSLPGGKLPGGLATTKSQPPTDTINSGQLPSQ
jgi:enterochelin esterase-like enzyme